MPNIPIIKGIKLIRVLVKKGFIINRIKGSHHILVHPTRKVTISVPIHKGKTLGRGIVAAIIKDAGLSVEEFLELL